MRRVLLQLLAVFIVCPVVLIAQVAENSPSAAEVSRKPTPAEQKAADLRLPKLDRSALQPENRQPVNVTEDERNPFGMVALLPGESRPVQVLKAESEETKLRRVLSNMRISGLAGSPGSYGVLIGPIPAREGEELPRIFADQAERLRVDSITEREVKLVFVESDKSMVPRTIGLTVDLRPKVTALMPGEVFLRAVPFGADGGVTLPPMQSVAVDSTLKGLEASDLESLTERSYDLMGTLKFPQDDASKAEPTR
jgi:hypothetical protein